MPLPFGFEDKKYIDMNDRAKITVNKEFFILIVSFTG
jgi:hypothetical protein